MPWLGDGTWVADARLARDIIHGRTNYRPWSHDTSNLKRKAPVTESLNEPILEGDYPMYHGYYYVADGKVIQANQKETVLDYKTRTGTQEVRRCDAAKRGLSLL
jgi:hypothetical protein